MGWIYVAAFFSRLHKGWLNEIISLNPSYEWESLYFLDLSVFRLEWNLKMFATVWQSVRRLITVGSNWISLQISQRTKKEAMRVCSWALVLSICRKSFPSAVSFPSQELKPVLCPFPSGIPTWTARAALWETYFVTETRDTHTSQPRLWSRGWFIHIRVYHKPAIMHVLLKVFFETTSVVTFSCKVWWVVIFSSDWAIVILIYFYFFIFYII